MLETLIDNTGLRDKVHDLHFTHPPYDVMSRLDQDKISVSPSFFQGTGKLKEIYVSLEKKQHTHKKLESPEEIYRLTKEYGGHAHLRIRLDDLEGRRGISSCIFDMSFYNWPWYPGMKEENILAAGGRLYDDKKIYERRELLQKIFDLFHIHSFIDDEKKIIAYQSQENMHFGAEAVKKAYEILLHTGCVPSIANGGEKHGFHLFQHLSWDHQMIHPHLSLSIGGYGIRSQDELPHGSLELLDMTLARHGIHSLDKDWVYTGTRLAQVKDVKGVFAGYHECLNPESWVPAESYKGNVVVH